MIEINNLTNVEIDEDFIKKITQEVLKKEKKQGNISLAFLGPARMRKINKKYRGKNKVTNVLSFSENEISFKNLGEIIICLREIKKSSQRINISFEKELARVLIHGILHLLGYDHEKSEEEARKMEEREEYYLGKIQTSNI